MFKRFSLIGLLAFAPAAFADGGQANGRTITVQPGQGSAFTITVPTAVEAPYALTGRNNSTAQVQLVRIGQADVFIAKN